MNSSLIKCCFLCGLGADRKKFLKIIKSHCEEAIAAKECLDLYVPDGFLCHNCGSSLLSMKRKRDSVRQRAQRIINSMALGKFSTSRLPQPTAVAVDRSHSALSYLHSMSNSTPQCHNNKRAASPCKSSPIIFSKRTKNDRSVTSAMISPIKTPNLIMSPSKIPQLIKAQGKLIPFIQSPARIHQQNRDVLLKNEQATKSLSSIIVTRKKLFATDMEPLNAVSEDLTEIVKNSYDDQKIFLTASEFLIASKGTPIANLSPIAYEDMTEKLNEKCDEQENLLSVSNVHTKSKCYNHVDHGYARVVKKTMKKKNRSQITDNVDSSVQSDYLQTIVAHNKIMLCDDNKKKHDNDVKDAIIKLRSVIETIDSFDDLANVIMNMQQLKESIERCILKTVHSQATVLRKKKIGYVSFLMKKDFEDLKSISFVEIIDEMRQKIPFLYNIIMSIALPQNQLVSTVHVNRIAPRLAMCYGIIMQSGFHEMSLMQRLTSLILLSSLADKKEYDRFQRLGVCLSYSSSLSLLNRVSDHFEDKIVDAIKSGKKIRIVGDNVNWTVKVHDEVLHHTTHMNHAFASAVIIDMHSVENDTNECNQDHFHRQFSEFIPSSLIPSNEDLNFIEYKYALLIAEIVTTMIPVLTPYKKWICELKSLYGLEEENPVKQIKHDIAVLPILLKNEQNYHDVSDILDSYEKVLLTAAEKAEVNITNLKVQISGDQLTRERFSGAKCLRGGHDKPEDRYVHLTPITFGLFHMQMNLLQIIFNRLYNHNSVQEVGTLRNLKERLARKQVKDDVNNNYDADAAFFNTVTRAYVLIATMEYFSMTHINDSIKRHTIKCEQSDSEWFVLCIKDIVKTFIIQHPSTVIEDAHVQSIQLPTGRIVELVKKIEHQPIPGKDYVYNYARNILNLGLFFIIVQDMVSTPKRIETLKILKVAMLYFKAGSSRSKYANEVVRLLVHQYCRLNEREAKFEFEGLYVNVQGIESTYIPTDLFMEYVVKDVKKHIKHMQSGQTLHNIEVHTKAISGIQTISEHFDELAEVIIRCTKHKHISDRNDILLIVNDLISVKPFSYTPGRNYVTFSNIKLDLLDELDDTKFNIWLYERCKIYAFEIGN